MVMMLFEIKTAFYKEKVIKREMQNLIMPRSNSMGSKTQQRSKTDKEFNEVRAVPTHLIKLTEEEMP